MVFRLALSYTGNKVDAEDVMQDVFLRLLESQPVFESSEHEKAWLLRVTINCCKSFLTSAWRTRARALDESASITDTYNEHESVLAAVMKLPEDQRLCVHLFYYEDLSQDMISERTGMNKSTVKSHLFRARAALKESLKEAYPDV